MTEKEKMLAGKLYDANPLSNWVWRGDCFVVCPACRRDWAHNPWMLMHQIVEGGSNLIASVEVGHMCSHSVPSVPYFPCPTSWN